LGTFQKFNTMIITDVYSRIGGNISLSIVVHHIINPTNIIVTRIEIIGIKLHRNGRNPIIQSKPNNSPVIDQTAQYSVVLKTGMHVDIIILTRFTIKYIQSVFNGTQ